MAALHRTLLWRHLVRRTLSTSTTTPLRTCLYDFHVSKQGKMVDFAGYMLPVLYGKEGLTESHRHVREHCGVFDVSHMMQSTVRGKHAADFMESITVADVKGMGEGTSSLTVFTNQKGGIVDDLIITKAAEDELYVVSNAGCRTKDSQLLQTRAAEMRSNGQDVTVEEITDRALLAVQGPESARVLQSFLKEDLRALQFMRSTLTLLAGIPCRITRCGYTGEDGFELSIPSDTASDMAERLLASCLGQVRPAGLGARDSLRLEAGLCLYGNDMNEEVTPIEAGLAWLVAARRRKEAGFPGADVVLGQLKEPAKVKSKRIGFVGKDGPPPRRGATLWVGDVKVGEVTSGCPSPSLGVNVAMAYVNKANAKVGTELTVEVRGKRSEVKVTKMPFVPAKYYVQKN